MMFCQQCEIWTGGGVFFPGDDCPKCGGPVVMKGAITLAYDSVVAAVETATLAAYAAHQNYCRKRRARRRSLSGKFSTAELN